MPQNIIIKTKKLLELARAKRIRIRICKKFDNKKQFLQQKLIQDIVKLLSLC